MGQLALCVANARGDTTADVTSGVTAGLRGAKQCDDSGGNLDDKDTIAQAKAGENSRDKDDTKSGELSRHDCDTRAGQNSPNGNYKGEDKGENLRDDKDTAKNVQQGKNKYNINGVKDNIACKDYSKSFLANLPNELLVKILSYLPILDKIKIRQVSQRFRSVGEIPVLYKEFIWPDYDSRYSKRHLFDASNMIRKYGDHVRRMILPAHACVTPMELLKIGRSCTKVRYFALSKPTQLSLNYLEIILSKMTHLEQLDLCVDGRFTGTGTPVAGEKFIDGLLQITAGRVRNLKLRISNARDSVCTVASMKKWADKGNPLPPFIDIFTATNSPPLTYRLLSFWLNSNSESSFEIGLYHNKRIPMNLYFSMPLSKFKFGLTTTLPFIRLCDHGIEGVQDDMFHLSSYDHDGVVRYTITAIGFSFDRCGRAQRAVIPSDSRMYKLFIAKRPFNCINNLHSVTYINIFHSNIHSDQLKQLALACSSLQRLNLKGNVNCLEDLLGLKLLIERCKNLIGLNLAGISEPSVESHLKLWKLLSSMKRLSHLAIDLCLLKPHCVSERYKLKFMFASCRNLQVLELHCGCTNCRSNTEYLFSYFPSLTHCRMSGFQFSGLKYALTKCHKIKCLYEEYACEEQEDMLPLPCIRNLQQLYINSVNATYFNVSPQLTHALSAHGGLECVVLHVNKITINSIVILINNSPNLVLLRISSKISPFRRSSLSLDYTNIIRKVFRNSGHKLFAVGSLKAYVIDSSLVHVIQDTELFDTNLNSMWV